MARGFVTSQYVDDNGTPWRLKVDADYVLDPDRGFIAGGAPGLYPLPRHWQPRRVMGIADDGRTAFAICATTAAALWTGAATRFWYSGNDGVVYWATVITRFDEVRRD